MQIQIATLEDINEIKEQLSEIKSLLQGHTVSAGQWIRSREAKRILGVSDSSLQSYRKSKRLESRLVKEGGKIYEYWLPSVSAFKLEKNES